MGETQIFKQIKTHPLYLLMVAFPLSILASLLDWGAGWIFVFSAVGIIPLAGIIGDSTEVLASNIGPKMGGLINATLGNAAELIITLFAIKRGLLDLVKASLTGSIIGNLLFVLGLSIFLGGVKNGEQKFDRRHTVNNTILLAIAVVGLVTPSMFSYTLTNGITQEIEILSICVATVMIFIYSLGIIYSLKSKAIEGIGIRLNNNVGNNEHKKNGRSFFMLAISTVGVIWLSELLVGSVEEVVANTGISEIFLGIILVPIIGNIAEHLVAVKMAIKNKMELSMEIAISSSLQIALFVSPILVFVSLLMKNPLTLVFNPIELSVLGASVLICYFVAADGESNWLEGAALLAVYVIFGLAFYFFPG
ncbi:MAG: calcium/proton exchanger [Chloroflexi bacterium]|nr:calcium/proton exchanger [Chloroflexota bacterium]